jgi:hypothetical protein
VTWWRWRHDDNLGMPPLTEINGRLYGQWGAFADWWANLSNAKQIAAHHPAIQSGDLVTADAHGRRSR